MHEYLHKYFENIKKTRNKFSHITWGPWATCGPPGWWETGGFFLWLWKEGNVFCPVYKRFFNFLDKHVFNVFNYCFPYVYSNYGWWRSVTEMMLSRDPKEEMMKAFKLFDDDDSGKISLRNLKRVARYCHHVHVIYCSLILVKSVYMLNNMIRKQVVLKCGSFSGRIWVPRSVSGWMRYNQIRSNIPNYNNCHNSVIIIAV